VHWVDGLRAESLPLPDRGLNFGDGLFETMLFAQQRVFYQDLHLSRLRKGMTVLGFPDCITAVQAQLSSVAEELKSIPTTPYAVRLTLTRGDGPRGYAPGIACTPRVIISAAVLEENWQLPPPAAAAGIAKIRWSQQPQLAGLKHLNRLEQVLAARERMNENVDELIMLDEHSSVISTVSGNLFAVIDEVLVTPQLSKCGIEGTRRGLIMDRWAREIGIDSREANINVRQLLASSEVFFCNALVGLRPISSLGSSAWSTYPICEALHQVYCGENA
jgi:4-amino-4-deoxychorismate lyase